MTVSFNKKSLSQISFIFTSTRQNVQSIKKKVKLCYCLNVCIENTRGAELATSVCECAVLFCVLSGSLLPMSSPGAWPQWTGNGNRNTTRTNINQMGSSRLPVCSQTTNFLQLNPLRLEQILLMTFPNVFSSKSIVAFLFII